jgi:hypothetical protein
MAWAVQQFNWLRFHAVGQCLGQEIDQQRDYLVGLVGGAGLDSAALLEAWAIEWNAAMLPQLPQSFQMVRYTLDKCGVIDSEGNGIRHAWPTVLLHDEFTAPDGVIGDLAGSVLPLQVSIRVRKVTAGGGDTDYWAAPADLTLSPAPAIVERRFRGRVSYGPVSSVEVDGVDFNRVTPTSRALIADAFDELISPVLGVAPDVVELNEIVVSMIHSNAVRVSSLGTKLMAFQAIESYDVATIVGTSDRRTPRT